MKFPQWLTVYGDKDRRGECPTEQTEQINIFSWLEFNHPELSAIAVHPKNEGKRSWGQVHHDKKSGSINTGASDVIIPGSPSFVCEIKRANHTKSQWQKGQREYLENASDCGAFVCVALGLEGFKQAVKDYLTTINAQKGQNNRKETV